jgi:hypothetical protein
MTVFASALIAIIARESDALTRVDWSLSAFDHFLFD